MEDYIIPAKRFSFESRVANSRFIASISPVFSVQEAKEFITFIKDVYRDASHNVPVYLIGYGATMIAHSSDDGEPSGTAGRPALAVLKGSGLGDTAIVITRYFGGTKLGTGGLVKAYSNSARKVIEAVPKAKKILVHHVSMHCPYNLYEHLKRSIVKCDGTIIDENFTDIVKITFSIPVDNFPQVKDLITELSQGQIIPETISLNQISIIQEK